ncbi:hypothetical protein E2562_025556 [Oryza meyeriana var. granulata]|uniref:RING-type E3 ubiquitin transferase n=1 Tax=Oryza meyeriana var. granulata TaxID=110450 RepID=A0A6G1FCA6_9ORYZ|nr:hypothetical protein E2562_025556 [Oryza meyeriana var. granulata]
MAATASCRACYGVSVACVSLLLFCVLAASVSVTKACAVAGLAVLLFGVIGWFVPLCGAGSPPRAVAASGGAVLGNDAARGVSRCACRLVGAALIATLPAYVYEGPAYGGGGSKHGGSVLCAVCLEDVQRGETVRRLPACCHLFHKDCIDMWLHSHTTCPLCRCEVLLRRPATKAATAAAESTSADADSLPPV